jgi:hypothetical protein
MWNGTAPCSGFPNCRRLLVANFPHLATENLNCLGDTKTDAFPPTVCLGAKLLEIYNSNVFVFFPPEPLGFYSLFSILSDEWMKYFFSFLFIRLYSLLFGPLLLFHFTNLI